MNDPGSLVSICIPTYNGESYLLEALNSVKRQNHKNIELVISDNNSDDGTVRIIRDFIKTVDFPVTFVSNQKIGIGSNWNNCVRHSRGEYIKFLFQDDVLYENCLDRLLEAFENHDVGMVYCNKDLIGDIKDGVQEKNDLHFGRYMNMQGVKILSDKEFFRHPRNKIGEPTCVMIRKEVFEKVGKFNEKLKQSLDYEFYYRLMKHYMIKSVGEKLVQFRVHDNQATARNAWTVITDSYLLPFLLLRDHFWKLHFQVRLTLVYKLFTGLIRNVFAKKQGVN